MVTMRVLGFEKKKKNKTKYKCKKATINNFAKILMFRINNLN